MTLEELRDAYACSCANPAYVNANAWPEIEAAAALIAALEAENERLRSNIEGTGNVLGALEQIGAERDEAVGLLAEIAEGPRSVGILTWDRIQRYKKVSE